MDRPTDQLPPTRPRRGGGRVLVLTAVFGGLLMAVLLAALVVAVDRTGEAGPPGAGSGDLDQLFAPVAAQVAEPAEDKAGPGRHPRRGPLRLRDGEKVVAGAVSSVGDGNLVVRKDDGAEVTVPTDGDTKVRGHDNRALTDLQAGERVIVKAGADGKADGVLVVRAHAAGTVTKLEGDRATLVTPGGLTKELDLSGVSQRPSVGTVVVAVGTAADDGATLKVEQLRELPTLG